MVVTKNLGRGEPKVKGGVISKNFLKNHEKLFDDISDTLFNE